MGRKITVKGKRVTYTDTSSGVLKHSTVSVPKTPRGPKQVDHSHDVPVPKSYTPPSRGRDFGSPPVTSGTRRTFPTATDERRERQQTARAEKLEREREHRETKRARGQGRVWAAEMLADPLDFLLTPTKPTRREAPPKRLLLDPGGGYVEEDTGRKYSLAEGRKKRRADTQAAEQDHRAWLAEQRRRRVAAQMGGLSSPKHPVIGDPGEYLVGTMTPERRAEVEGFRHHPGPVRERRTPTKRGDPQAAGFLGGHPEERLGQAGSLLGEVWGDVKDIGRGTYGSAVDYGSAIFADVVHPQLTQGPLSRTTRLAARDALGMVSAYERAVPEFPAWMGGDFQVVEHDPEKGFRFVVHDPDATAQGREAFRESWSRDPLLSALLLVPVASGVTRGASVGALRTSIRAANRGLSAKEVNRLARRESRMPGYAAGQGYGGGIKPRLIGGPKTTAKPTPGVVYESKPALARYPETGDPGYSFHSTKGGSDALFRDVDGTVRGFARATDEGSLKTWVDPDYRRQGVATNLYDTLSRNGVDVDRLSGVGPVTEQGAAFAAARGRVPGRPYSRTPQGRAIQRGYDWATSMIEDYLGPNATILGRYATSRRAARVAQRGQAKDIAREGAWIARHEATIRQGVSRWSGKHPKPEAEYQQALVAALEAPESMSARVAVETKVKHLASLDPERTNLPLQGQIAQLQGALRGSHLESSRFEAGLDSMVALSERAEGLARTVLGMTDEALLDRRNRVLSAWQEAGLVEEGVGPARGFFPHRSTSEVVPSAIAPTALAATGRVVGRPRFPTNAFHEHDRNKLALYKGGRVNTNPRVLSDTLRGRYRYTKVEEGRKFLWDRGLPIVEGDNLPKEGFYLVRDPATAAKHIPDEVRSIIEHPSQFTRGDEAAMRSWANQWVRPSENGFPLEWESSMESVRLVPAGNVHTLLADAFDSAPRGSAASVVGLLNSLVRANLIYLPDFGTRYVLRNTAQNTVLMALTKPSAFMKLGTAVRGLRSKERGLWDSIQVETGSIQAAAGLPETSVRGVSKPQRLERAVTGGSRKVSGVLGGVADEPFRVAAWLKYAEEYGFKGKARWRELLNSDDPGIARVRDAIGQQVRDDLLDFDALSPAAREKVARFVFILPFQVAAAKWPVMYLRDHTLRTALIALAASQHDREGAEWGELEIGGRMQSLSWLSPISPLQEVIGSGVEGARAAGEGRFDASALGGMLSPVYRDLIQAGGRGGMGLEHAATTWVPGYSTYRNVFLRDEENLHDKIDRFLGTRPWRYTQSTQGKAAAWGEQVATLYGGVPANLIESKATKDEYETATRGKSEREKALWLNDRYFDANPNDEHLRAEWQKGITTASPDHLDDWKEALQKELGFESAAAVDSRLEVIDDLDDYFEKHPEDEQYRELWTKDIAHANDERLSGWRKTLKAG